MDAALIRSTHLPAQSLDLPAGCGTVCVMSNLSSTLRRLTSAQREDSRISAFWAYLGSFGDDFFSDDDDGSSDNCPSQRN